MIIFIDLNVGRKSGLEWIAIILEWRMTIIGDSWLLDAAMVTLRETAEKLRQALQGGK
jgi:hypothetical protein